MSWVKTYLCVIILHYRVKRENFRIIPGAVKKVKTENLLFPPSSFGSCSRKELQKQFRQKKNAFSTKKERTFFDKRRTYIFRQLLVSAHTMSMSIGLIKYLNWRADYMEKLRPGLKYFELIHSQCNLNVNL